MKLDGSGFLQCRHLLLCCQFIPAPTNLGWFVGKKLVLAAFFFLLNYFSSRATTRTKCSRSSEHLRGPLSIANWLGTMFSFLEEASGPQMVWQMNGSLQGGQQLCKRFLPVGEQKASVSKAWHLAQAFQLLGIENSCLVLEITFTSAATPVKDTVTCS